MKGNVAVKPPKRRCVSPLQIAVVIRFWPRPKGPAREARLIKFDVRPAEL
jgi:hypothetical protein